MQKLQISMYLSHTARTYEQHVTTRLLTTGLLEYGIALFTYQARTQKHAVVEEYIKQWPLHSASSPYTGILQYTCNNTTNEVGIQAILLDNNVHVDKLSCSIQKQAKTVVITKWHCL